MKYIYILLFLSNFINASVDIYNNFDEITVKNEISYKISDNEKIKPEDILKEQHLESATSTNLGFLEDKSIWTKTQIKNITSNEKTIYIYNPLAIIDSLNIYVYFQDNLQKTYTLGDSKDTSNREFFSRFNVVKLTIPSQNSITLVANISNPHGRNEMGWIIMEEKYYFKFITRDLLIWGMIFSGLVLILIFQIFFYQTFKDKYFIFYICVIILIFIYLLTSSGFFYLFFGSSTLNDILVPMSGYSVFFFYILFLDNFWISEKNKFEKAIFIFIYIYSIFLLLGSLSSIFSNKFVTYDNTFFIISFLMIIWFICFSVKVSIKNKTFHIYYIFGQFVALFGYTFQALVSMGYLPTKSYNQQILGFSVLVEMVFFSYAISIMIKLSMIEKRKSQRLLLLQSNFTTIGESIKNISHQWKLPLARLGTLITQAHTIIKFENIKSNELENTLENINTSLSFLSQTVNDFKNFYQKNDSSKVVEVESIIKQIKILLVEKIHNANATIEYKEEEHILLKERSFIHIFLILIDNFLDISIQRKIDNPKIEILLTTNHNKINIIFMDNCGGIEQNPIDSIFEIGVTSSNSIDKGNGLSIVKLLIEDKFEGDIKVSNINNGAKFEIIFPIKTQKEMNEKI